MYQSVKVNWFLYALDIYLAFQQGNVTEYENRTKQDFANDCESFPYNEVCIYSHEDKFKSTFFVLKHTP